MRLVIMGALVAASSMSALADPEECQNAIDAYNTAISESSFRLKRYSQCLANSQGNDNCWTEFRRLKSAHDDFDSAVTMYQSECDQ